MSMNTEKRVWNGAHQVNQRQESHPVPLNGRDNERWVHVGSTIGWRACPFERGVQQVGEEGIRREEWLQLGCLIES